MCKMAEILESIVIDLAASGEGIVKKNGKVIFLSAPFDLARGDVVEFVITREKKSISFGEVVSMVEPVIFRRYAPGESPMGAAYPLYNLHYLDGWMWKREKTLETLERIGRIGKQVRKCESSYYGDDIRVSKLRLHRVGDAFGLYAARSHRLDRVDLTRLMPDAAEILPRLGKIIDGGETCVLRTDGRGLYLATDGHVRRDAQPLFCGGKDADGSWGELPCMQVGDRTYRVDIDGFFQNNAAMAEKALALLGKHPGESILDLYCGVGFLGLSAAREGSALLGVEANASAVARARENARANGVQAEFVAQDTAQFLRTYRKTPDLLILDPPRSGLGKTMPEDILRLGPPKIFYMSCDPATLARDLDRLGSAYRIEAFHMLDMFPYTLHVECVCWLTRVR